MVEFNVKDYVNDKSDFFKIATYEEWEADYLALKVEGKKLWAETGLADDVRAGWHKAAKENKLFAFGPYSVPLDVVEAIDEDTRQMLRCAGINKKASDDGKVSDTYVQILKDKIKGLEGDVGAKDEQIDTLLAVIADLRKVDSQSFQEEDEEQQRLAGVDEIELF